MQIFTHKVWLIMRLTTLLLLFGMATSFASSRAQSVSFQGQDASLKAVFDAVKKQTGYTFFYRSHILKDAKPVSLDLQNVSLSEFLDQLFERQHLAYNIQGTTVFVTKEKKTSSSSHFDSHSELMLILAFSEVRGRVVDSVGNPLIGASVRILNSEGKRTTLQTTTDRDGYFALRNVPENAVLEISYVGFITETVNAAPNTGQIVLRAAPSSLEEVEINAGYYTVKGRELTGNISRVTAKEIESQPVLNVMGALQGRMPGVYIRQSTGIPGSNFDIQIRGRNSLRTDGNDPLYIVDGVPFPSTSLGTSTATILGARPSPLNIINPADIQSIEVLKDADATAIYGSRGSNGVILITTKKGIAGKTKVDVNISQGVGSVPHMIDVLNTEQYLAMRREAYANDSVSNYPASAYDINGTWDQSRYTDWQEVLIGGTAHSTDAQVSASGGNANTQFLIRGNYSRQTTVFPGDFAYQRGVGHFNLAHTTDNQKFKATLTASYSADHNNLLSSDLTSIAIRLPPNAPTLYKSDGTLNWGNSTWQNPLAELQRPYSANSDNLIANIDISYRIVPGLLLKTVMGFNSLQREETRKHPHSAYNPDISNFQAGRSFFGNGKARTWIVEPQIEYQRDIGTGRLKVLGGVTAQQSIRSGQYLVGTGYTSDALLGDLRAAPNLSFSSNTYTQYRYQAIFGRINYNWRNRYILNVTGRRDGSSRFGPDRQFGNFGAAGIAWIFSNEGFIQNNLSFLSFGKLRTSYGITGSDQIGDYGYLDSYSSIEGYQGSSLVPSRIANPNYSWESNRKLEAALELGMLKDRFFLVTSWYRNRSSNQLVGQSLPATTGFPSIQENLSATVQNTGWEFELRTINIQGNNLSWTTSFNLTIPENKLLAYPDIESSSYRNTWLVGQSLFTTKKVHFMGVDPETGVYISEDVNGDGNTGGVEDRQVLKKLGQDFYGGFQNSIRYKEWELSVFVQFIRQTARDYIYYFQPPGVMSNQPAIVMDRWQQPGDITEVQRFTQNYGSNAGKAFTLAASSFSDHTVVDASFVRLQNVSLSWQLPAHWIQRATMQSAHIYVQGQNLFTLSNQVGFDPQNGFSTVLPPLRMIRAGIQCSF